MFVYLFLFYYYFFFWGGGGFFIKKTTSRFGSDYSVKQIKKKEDPFLN